MNVEAFTDFIIMQVREGGWVMIPLLTLLVLLWYFLTVRFLTLINRGDEKKLDVLLKDQKYFLEKKEGTITEGIYLSNQIFLNCDQMTKKNFEKNLNEVLFELYLRLDYNKKLIQVIIIIAPLLGLLGTVVGMIEVFDSFVYKESYDGLLTQGISKALVTTQMGLFIAIPGMLIGRWLNGKQEVIQSELVLIEDFFRKRFDDLKKRAM